MSDNHANINQKSFFFFRSKLGFMNGELRPKSPLLPRPQSGPLIALVRSSVTDKQTGAAISFVIACKELKIAQIV